MPDTVCSRPAEGDYSSLQGCRFQDVHPDFQEGRLQQAFNVLAVYHIGTGNLFEKLSHVLWHMQVVQSNHYANGYTTQGKL
jgi:hypothetical protein